MRTRFRLRFRFRFRMESGKGDGYGVGDDGEKGYRINFSAAKLGERKGVRYHDIMSSSNHKPQGAGKRYHYREKDIFELRVLLISYR